MVRFQKMAAAERLLRFGVSIVTVSLLSILSGAAQEQDTTIYSPGNGVTAPTAVKASYPQYTSDAMKAGIQGCNVVEAVVLPDATVGDVKLIRSLDSKYGMDERAVESAKKWVFKPGMKDGKSVAVRVTIMSCFTSGDAKKSKWRWLGLGK
jgi:TonB family protein